MAKMRCGRENAVLNACINNTECNLAHNEKKNATEVAHTQNIKSSDERREQQSVYEFQVFIFVCVWNVI